MQLPHTILKLYKSIFLMCLICSFQVAEAQMQWELLGGPYGGNVIAFAKDASGNYYAARNDAVFISEDKCKSWNKIKTPNITIVNMAVSTSGEIYLGAANDGLYISTNGGESWTNNDEIDNVSGLSVNSSGYVFAKNMRSTNKGATFYELNIDAMPNCYAFFGNDIYAGTNKGVFKSGDNGNNWSAINTGIEDKNIISITRMQNSRLVALAQANGIYYSDNEGNTWQTPEKSIGTKNITCVHAGQNNYLHATTTDSGAYRSADGGVNWENAGFAGEALNTVFASANEPMVLMGGARSGVLLSMMNGLYWSQSSIGMALNNVEKLCSTPEKLFTASRSGVYSIYYNGEKWYDHTSHLPKSIYYKMAVSGNIPVVIAGGNPYQNKPAAVLYYENGKWISFGELPQEVKAYSIIEANKHGDFVLGAGSSSHLVNAVVVKMKDSAQWKLVLKDSAIFINKILVDEEGYIFVHAQDFSLKNKIMRLPAASTDWNIDDMAVFTGFKLLGLDADGAAIAKNYNDFYRFNKSTGAWETTNAGAWQNADSALILKNSNDEIFIVKQDMCLLLAENSGDKTLIVSPDNDFYFLKDAVIAADNRLYVSTYKGIFRTSTGLNTPVQNHESIFGAVHIWPNPARQTINISYDLRSAQQVSSYIYNVNGKQLKALSSAYFQQGRHNLTADVSDLPAGIYFIKTVTNNEINTQKFIISAFIR